MPAEAQQKAREAAAAAAAAVAAAAAAADLVGKTAQPLAFASLSQVELYHTTGCHHCNGDGG